MQPETMSDFVQTELGAEAQEAFVSGADILRREGWNAGEKEGLERGEKKGRKKGHCEVLSKLLEQQFGPLPEDVRVRLENADIEQLSRWALRVLVAGSLAEVFAGEP